MNSTWKLVYKNNKMHPNTCTTGSYGEIYHHMVKMRTTYKQWRFTQHNVGQGTADLLPRRPIIPMATKNRPAFIVVLRM